MPLVALSSLLRNSRKTDRDPLRHIASLCPVWRRGLAAFALLLTGFVVPASSQVGFFAPIALEDQSSPFQVLQGNFYGAGHLDLVAIDAYSVNLYRNDGHGHFGPPKSLSTSPSGNFFFAGVVADFNKDGRPDIAVLEYPLQSASGFFLLLNNGNGNFDITTTVPQNNGQIILAGDFNGDGHPDVATVGAAIEVFAGDGAGNFGAGVSTPLPQISLSAVAADFNGDHKLDFAVGTNSLPNPSSILLFTGNGDGTFTAGITIPVSGSASGLAAADLNGDHKMDLLAGISAISTSAGSIDVFMGNGDGTFASPAAYSTPRGYSTLIPTEVNHSGHLDLVVGSGGSGQYGGAVSVLFGNGDGTFKTGVNSETDIAASTLVAGDYNEDGLTDVAFTQDDGIGGTTEVAFGIGGGHFVQTENYAAGNSPAEVFAGNFLGTGNADILSVGNGSFQLFASQGNGKFNKAANMLVQGVYPTIGVQAEFNGDGLPDVLIAGPNGFFGGPPSGMQVFFGQSGTKLAAGPAYAFPKLGISSLVAGDLNSDGLTDVVLVCYQPAGSYVTATGTGSGHFRFHAPVSTGIGASVGAIGDFNGDGKGDLVLGGAQAYILFGNGDGSFQPPVALTSAPDETLGAVAAADVNGDGKLDVVLAGTNTHTQHSAVCVLLGNGDGTFQKPACYAVGYNPVGLAIADYNNDGHLDIASVNAGGDGVTVLSGTGSGTFEKARSFAVGNSPTGIATADFNNDGRLDLATTNAGSASFISVLFNISK